MTEESVNRLLKMCIISVCLFVVSIPALSSTVSADENLTLYTDYYQYDNNETLEFHIVGTNNTTYTLMIFHRDSDAPLVIAYARTGENNTTTTGYIGLYEFENFGSMELRAFNKSYNQSAKCEFRLVPSQAWWTGEVDRLITDADARYNLSLYLIFALSMTLVGFMAAGYIKNREKMKAASGELTFAEKMAADGFWWFNTWKLAIAEDNPQVQSERFQFKCKMAYWRLMDLLKMKKEKMGGYQAVQKEIDELMEKMPFLVQDAIDEKVAAGILTQEEADKLTEEDHGSEIWKLLFPGEKRISLSD